MLRAIKGCSVFYIMFCVSIGNAFDPNSDDAQRHASERRAFAPRSTSAPALTPEQNDLAYGRALKRWYEYRDNRAYGEYAKDLYILGMYNRTSGAQYEEVNEFKVSNSPYKKIIPDIKLVKRVRKVSAAESAEMIKRWGHNGPTIRQWADAKISGVNRDSDGREMFGQALDLADAVVPAARGLFGPVGKAAMAIVDEAGDATAEGLLDHAHGASYESEVRNPATATSFKMLLSLEKKMIRDPRLRETVESSSPYQFSTNQSLEQLRQNPAVQSHMNQEDFNKFIDESRRATAVDNEKTDDKLDVILKAVAQQGKQIAELKSQVEEMIENGKDPSDLQAILVQLEGAKEEGDADKDLTEKERQENVQQQAMFMGALLQVYSIYGPQDRDTQTAIIIAQAGVQIYAAVAGGAAAGGVLGPYGAIAGAIVGAVSAIHSMDAQRAEAKRTAKTWRALFAQLSALRDQIDNVYKSLSAQILGGQARASRERQAMMDELKHNHALVMNQLERLERTVQGGFADQSERFHYLAQLGHRIHNEVIRSDDANQKRHGELVVREKTAAHDVLQSDQLDFGFALDEDEIARIGSAGGALPFGQYKEKMNLIRNSAVKFSRGPIATGPGIGDDVSNINLFLGEHLRIRDANTNAQMIADGLAEFGVVLTPSSYEDREFDGPVNPFDWVRNAEHFYRYASKRVSSLHPNYGLYEKHYRRYDPSLRHLSSLLAIGHEQQQAMEEILPTDKKGRPAVYRLGQLLRNYEERLENAAALINDYEFNVDAADKATFDAYDLLKPPAHQPVRSTAKPLKPLEREVGPCPDYIKWHAKEDREESLPKISIKEPELLLASIPKMIKMARDVLDGEINLCYANIRTMGKQLSVRIIANYEGSKAGRIKVFEKTLIDEDRYYSEGIEFERVNIVSTFVERWNNSDEFRKQLFSNETHDRVSSERKAWNDRFLNELIAERFTQHGNVKVVEKVKSLQAGSSVMEDALTELEGARLLLFSVAMPYGDAELENKLLELPGKSKLISDYMNSGLDFDQEKYKHSTAQLVSYLADAKEAKAPRVGFMDQTLNKLEMLYIEKSKMIKGQAEPFDSSPYHTQYTEAELIQMTKLNDVYLEQSKLHGAVYANHIADAVKYRAELKGNDTAQYEKDAQEIVDNMNHMIKFFGPNAVRLSRKYDAFKMSPATANLMLSRVAEHGVPDIETQEEWLKEFRALRYAGEALPDAQSKVEKVILSKDYQRGEREEELDKAVASRQDRHALTLELRKQLDGLAAEIISYANEIEDTYKHDIHPHQRMLSGAIAFNRWISAEEKDALLKKHWLANFDAEKVKKYAEDARELRDRVQKYEWRTSNNRTTMDRLVVEFREHLKDHPGNDRSNLMGKLIHMRGIRNDVRSAVHQVREGEITPGEMEYYGEGHRYRHFGNVYKRVEEGKPLEDGEAYTARKKLNHLSKLLKSAKGSRNFGSTHKLERQIEDAEAELAKHKKWQKELNE